MKPSSLLLFLITELLSNSNASVPPNATFESSFYQRTLPSSCIALDSVAGKSLFKEAWNQESSGVEMYFPLIQQLTTQNEPPSCGLASLVVVLNAMHVDPKRLWKNGAPWRWISEDNVRECGDGNSIEKAEHGMGFDEFTALATCNGVTVTPTHVTLQFEIDTFRKVVAQNAAQNKNMLVLNYSRRVLGQTGVGHFSPLGGYHAATDKVLILDVARFKYPPHWVSLSTLVAAMRTMDDTSGEYRGYFLVSSPQTNL